MSLKEEELEDNDDEHEEVKHVLLFARKHSSKQSLESSKGMTGVRDGINGM